MEVAGALSIFQRSQSLYNVRYTKYLGDGDSKAFTSIVENKVYGDHCSVEKLEWHRSCYEKEWGHVFDA
ncbi:hypothetical protein TNCV_3315941 [Trichonephila clavipes]|nr:hypothetical protein TNCV_3315941 [Trichonephila clavipes]